MLKYNQRIVYTYRIKADPQSLTLRARVCFLEKIDFVMIWVDGSDPKWLEEKSKYDPSSGDNKEVRFRDWDNLQFWFRGVEKFAPWVNKVHFVTWGHIPEWLNTDNPKLNIVNHRDYIPEKYLPTFNSHTIELNLHRIKGLSEQFVYFNDDMFVTAPVKPGDFFKDGRPMDTYAMDCIFFRKDSAGAFNGNDMELINSNFNKNVCMKKDFTKWFSPANGIKRVTKTAALNMWPWFPGMYYNHLSSNFLKSTFETVWEKEYDVLDATCSCRFRSKLNVNQWLMKYWQLADGKAIPRSVSIGNCYHLKEENYLEACRAVETGRHRLICLNDIEKTFDFEKIRDAVLESFDRLLPEKSSFER